MWTYIVAGVLAIAALQPATQPPTATPLLDPVTINNQIGVVLQKGTEGSSLTVEQDGNRGWSILDGETTIANNRINPPGLAKSLSINLFTVGKDAAIVKVVLSPSKRTTEFAKLLETVDIAEQPVLIDTKGTKYPAVGFIYRDDTMTRVRYTLGHPLKGLKEAPAISRNRPDRELTLIFTVNNGVDIKELRVGKVSLEDWAAAPKHVEAPPKR